MNATIEATDFNESIVLNKTSKKQSLSNDSFEDNEFFKGLIQRARFYEQFENRKSKITYSVVQTDIGIY